LTFHEDKILAKSLADCGTPHPANEWTVCAASSGPRLTAATPTGKKNRTWTWD
jgi:hypothetical protein